MPNRTIKLQSKTFRRSLTPRPKPYWQPIDRGLALGYRKLPSGGTWILRKFINGKYKEVRLGQSDDIQSSDGKLILSFIEAQKIGLSKEKNLFKSTHSLGSRKLQGYTVKDSITDYLEWFKLERKSYLTTKQACDAHIIPKLGNHAVGQLTTTQLRDWRNEIARSPRTVRGKVVQNAPYEEWSEDEKRKRKSTANRVLTVLKAALNHAWRNELIEDSSAWQRLKPFHNVDSPKTDYFSPAEIRIFLSACDEDFKPLALSALYTGCRYGELAKLQCKDLDVHNRVLTLPDSKSNKPRNIPLIKSALSFFKDLADKKSPDDLLITHIDGRSWGRSHQKRPMDDACEKAGIKPYKGFHVLRHTFATELLRPKDDSPGVPVRFVAEALGNSVRICEKHYAHVLQADLSKLIEDNLLEIQ